MIENNCLNKTGKCLLVSMLVTATVVLTLSACGSNTSSSTTGAAAAEAVPFEILWMNDTHGYFVPTYHAEYTEVDSYATTAATEGTVGGYARIAGMVKGFKAKATDAVFVDGGDTFDGSPVAQLTQGTAVVPVLNKMGIDVAIPGNRDFAWDKQSFLAVAGCQVVGVDCTSPQTFTTTGVAGGNNGFSGDPATVAAATTTPGLNYPLIAANLLDGTTKLPVLRRYYIKQTPNLKIAFIGIASPLSGTKGFLVEGALTGSTTPNGFKIENEISSLAATIRQNEKPDLVVAISHMGYFQDRKFASRSTGIDVIIGAHTHHNVTNPPAIPNADGSRNVVVVQAGSHGKYLGKLDLMVSGGKVVSFTNDLVRVTAANVAKYALGGVVDPDVDAAATAAYAPFKAQMDTVVGYTTTVIERRGDTQSTMSSLMTDAMASVFGTDLSSFVGIRYGSSIPGSVANPFPITYGDVVNMVSPNITSGNGVYVATTTGTSILSGLTSGLNNEYGPDIYTWGGGDVTRYNKNLKYTYNITAADGAHIVDLKVINVAGGCPAPNGAGECPLVVAGIQNASNVAATFTMANFSGTVANMVPATTAVDEIVKYIQAQPLQTVGPTLDDRAVCLDKPIDTGDAAVDLQNGFHQCYGTGTNGGPAGT